MWPLSLSLLFSFSAHLFCSHGHCVVYPTVCEWQPPARWLLTPLCHCGGCSPLFSSFSFFSTTLPSPLSPSFSTNLWAAVCSKAKQKLKVMGSGACFTAAQQGVLFDPTDTRHTYSAHWYIDIVIFWRHFWVNLNQFEAEPRGYHFLFQGFLLKFVIHKSAKQFTFSCICIILIQLF